MILLRQCDPCGNEVVKLSLDETYYTEADSPALTVTLPATYPAGSSLRVVIKNYNGVVVKSQDYTLPLAANPIILDPLTWGRHTVAAMILYETTRIACKSESLPFYVSKVACTNCGYAPYRIACTIGDGGEFTDLSACAAYGTGSARLMLPAPANSISATLVQTASPCVWTAVINTSPLLAFRQYLDGDCADDDPAITNTSLTWTLTRTSGTEWTLVVTLTATGDEIYRSVTTQAWCEDPFNFTGNTATDFPLPNTNHGTGVPDLVGEQAAEANPLNDAVTMPRLLRECGTGKLLRACAAPRNLCDAPQMVFVLTGPLTPVPCVPLDEWYWATPISAPDSLLSDPLTLVGLGELGQFADMTPVGAAAADVFPDNACTAPPEFAGLSFIAYTMRAFICTTNGFDFGTPYLTYIVFGYLNFWPNNPLVLYSGQIKCADALEGAILPNNGTQSSDQPYLCNETFPWQAFTGGTLTAVYA